jgi:pyrroline-5-carboxylate reductase
VPDPATSIRVFTNNRLSSFNFNTDTGGFYELRIIGTGKEGQALARKQIEVAIGSRRQAEALASVAKAIGQTIIPESLQEAVKADIIILAIPPERRKKSRRPLRVGRARS